MAAQPIECRLVEMQISVRRLVELSAFLVSLGSLIQLQLTHVIRWPVEWIV